MSKSQYSLTSDEIDSLYKYWDDLNPIISITDNKVISDIKQDVRSAILWSLRDGLEENYQGELRLRHVLRANEIRKIIEEKLGKPISRPNLYFHLDKLQGYGLVKIVKKIVKGGNHISYYSRTAKIFLWSVKNEMKTEVNKSNSKYIENYLKLTKLFNPDVSDEYVINLFENVLNYKEKLHPVRVDWLREHHEKIISAGLDVTDINNLLNELYAVQKQPSHLAELIKLWQLK